MPIDRLRPSEMQREIIELRGHLDSLLLVIQEQGGMREPRMER